ncbi:DUF262 domain-containing protein [Pantoea eucalypti]|uniref:DUF262 domain-containing protein n=1 Tax=Pantoea eucalypti TaxID=470933 RepID=UPI00301C60BE
MIKIEESDNGYNEEILRNNQEEVLGSSDENDVSQLVVYSRDWTVQTIVQQIDDGNVDLNPDFQRRNVWDNQKRSRLIESLMVGYPVPEIVLAEVIGEKKKYVVIDGKQRLLAIYGFSKLDSGIWDGAPKLKDQTILNHNNGLMFDEFTYEEKRRFMNSDVRCTLLSGYKNYSTLYDIFYRLNTGSSPLTMQELRNSIYKGYFSSLIIKHTDQNIPLRRILNIKSADKRFKDTEILLKFLYLEISKEKYSGNLRRELDDFTSLMNSKWNEYSNDLINKCYEFDKSCQFILDVFSIKKLDGVVAKKWLISKNEWESRFNRSLFEVQVHYALKMSEDSMSIDTNIAELFIEGVKDSFADERFVSAVESTTSGVNQHVDRFNIFFKKMNERLNKNYSVPFSVDL